MDPREVKRMRHNKILFSSIWLIVSLWGGVLPFSGQTSGTKRQVQVTGTKASSSESLGAYYALVIGNDNYRYVAKLKTAVNDANAMAQLLRERYGFTTEVLLDATRNRILTAMNEYRRTLPENSNLLIYYAGHGHHDLDTDKAYWLPIDAKSDNNDNWISADDITSDVKAIPSQHVLIISDSCYSGVLSRGAEVGINPEERGAYLAKMRKSKSRNLMSSGGDEPVADSGAPGHSIFAGTILESFRQMEEDSFTAADVFHRFIQPGVAGRSDQVPQYSLIRDSGHAFGDFVFSRKGGAVVAAATREPETTADTARDVPGIGKGTGSTSSRTNSTSTPALVDLTAAKKQYEAGNFTSAFPIFKQASEAGNPEAMSYLANYYLTGSELPKDDAAALRLYRKSADAGNARGMTWLGFMYKHGRGVDQDYPEAVRWYRKAIAAGYPPAMTDLGIMYESGYGVDKDYPQALTWYRKAAGADDAAGMRNLGKMYENGLGIKKDDSAAVKWYRKSADAGYAPGMTDLGIMYLGGKGVQKNSTEAVSWFRKGADLGAPGAMGNLGFAYERGDGIEKNIPEAERWYSKAANLGDEWAADRLKHLQAQIAQANSSAGDARAQSGSSTSSTQSSARDVARQAPVAPATVPAIVNAPRFAVVHYGGADAKVNCMGWMTVEAGMLRFRAVQGTDGMHSYDFPAASIKEIKKNAMIGSAYQAFHVRLNSGEVFNFSVFDPNTKTFLNADSLLLAVHADLGK